MPFFISRTLCLFVLKERSYALQTLVTRFSFIGYLIGSQMIGLLEWVGKRLIKLHNDIYDSRFLVGTELTNR